jgi:hypothetical protein
VSNTLTLTRLGFDLLAMTGITPNTPTPGREKKSHGDGLISI